MEEILSCQLWNFKLLESYYVGDKNTLCLTGPIENEIECKAAADSLGYSKSRFYTERTNYWPGGCYLTKTNIIYFNKANPGKRRISAHPICGKGKHEIS